MRAVVSGQLRLLVGGEQERLQGWSQQNGKLRFTLKKENDDG